LIRKNNRKNGAADSVTYSLIETISQIFVFIGLAVATTSQTHEIKGKHTKISLEEVAITNVITTKPMGYKVKVLTVGNSTGIVLPKDLLTKLKIQKGDFLYATETPYGFQLTPYNEKFAKTMEAATEVMRRYRDTLQRLGQE
jgi:putative addiction module antidote